MQLEPAKKMDLDYIHSWLQVEEAEYQDALASDPYGDHDRGFFVISQLYHAYLGRKNLKFFGSMAMQLLSILANS